MKAIEHAYRVNSWFEHLLPEEQPPEWMWPYESQLTPWFEEVESNRKQKYNGDSGSSSGGDEEVPLMDNELARDRR